MPHATNKAKLNRLSEGVFMPNSRLHAKPALQFLASPASTSPFFQLRLYADQRWPALGPSRASRSPFVRNGKISQTDIRASAS